MTPEQREAYNAKRRAQYHAGDKAARLAQCKAWQEANRERVRENARAYAAAHPGLAAGYTAAYRARHPEKIKARTAATKDKMREYSAQHYARMTPEQIAERREAYKRWAAANPHKVAAHAAKRRASLQQRTPAWLTDDDHWMIEQAYDIAAKRTEVTGIEWHVDHKIPLKGRRVSGLHVPMNLQVIPAIVNMRKHNIWEAA